jgi:ComEC/Rec2-related protein
LIKNQICSLVEAPIGENFGNQVRSPAKQIFTVKILINQVKDYLKTNLYLLKFRFFGLKNSLEEYQTKKSEALLLWHQQDYLQFMNGLVLGQKSPQASFLPAFTNAGLLHVLVASGFNVALVGGLAWKMTKKISRIGQLAIVFLAVWGYVIYLEFEPPLLRAAWMFSLVLGLKYLGLRTNRINILACSVALILVFKPDLIDSLSLWLSALATLGIMVFSRRLFMFWSEQPRLAGGILGRLGSTLLEEGEVSLAAQALIFPVLAWYFHSANFVSFLANPLLLPWLGTITQLSGLQFFLSLVSQFWPLRLASWWLAQILNQFFAWYFAAVAWWQKFYFLNYALNGDSTKLVIAGWIGVISLVWLITRTKQETKNHFFHEKT